MAASSPGCSCGAAGGGYCTESAQTVNRINVFASSKWVVIDNPCDRFDEFAVTPSTCHSFVTAVIKNSVKNGGHVIHYEAVWTCLHQYTHDISNLIPFLTSIPSL